MDQQMEEIGLHGGMTASGVVKDGGRSVPERMVVGDGGGDRSSRQLVTTTVENSVSVTGGPGVSESGLKVILNSVMVIGGPEVGPNEGAGLELAEGEGLNVYVGPNLDSEASISSPFKPKIRKWKKTARHSQQKGSPIMRNRRKSRSPSSKCKLFSSPVCEIEGRKRKGVVL
ncbi:hypothetical protein ACOSP7_029032 [Xanthoceras sorbifolium]